MDGRMGFFSREKADEEKAVELLKGEERGESRLPIFAGGWSSGKKGGEGRGCTGLRWRRPVYRCDVIRKHAGSTNLSQGMGRGRGSNLVQRNEFSARPPLRFAAPSSSPHFPQGFVPFPLEFIGALQLSSSSSSF